jgi:hypothetical protein
MGWGGGAGLKGELSRYWVTVLLVPADLTGSRRHGFFENRQMLRAMSRGMSWRAPS